jgi:hypothetical protein
MAKSSRVKSVPQSTTKRPPPKRAKGVKTARSKTVPTKSQSTPELFDDAAACDCCAGFLGLEIGQAGFAWRDAAGEFHVLVHPGGNKVLMWDANGPYFANP